MYGQRGTNPHSATKQRTRKSYCGNATTVTAPDGQPRLPLDPQALRESLREVLLADMRAAVLRTAEQLVEDALGELIGPRFVHKVLDNPRRRYGKTESRIQLWIWLTWKGASHRDLRCAVGTTHYGTQRLHSARVARCELRRPVRRTAVTESAARLRTVESGRT